MDKARNYDVRRGLPSASAMHRISKCPGSVALINRLRDEGKLYQLINHWMNSGTKIHQWLAVRSQPNENEKLAEIEKEMTPVELSSGRKCEALRQEIIAAWRDANKIVTAPNLFIEQRLWYRQGILPRFSAQADFIADNSYRALIINYKTGRLEADSAADNLQLRTEVVAFAHNWPGIREIEAAIVEPLVTWQNERVVYSGDTLLEAENHILAIADAALWQSHERYPGQWCVNCPARANCPEARKYVESIPAPRPGHELWELPRGGAGTELWLKIQNAQKILKSLETAYEQILENDPHALPGLVLPSQGRARRIVPYPARLKDALAEYLTSDEIDGCAEFHLSKIQEVMGLKHHLNGAELTKKFEALTKDVVEITHDKPFIRPLTKKERDVQAAQSKIIKTEDAFA